MSMLHGPPVIEASFTLRTPEDVIFLASRADVIQPKQLLTCLQWCLNKCEECLSTIWLDAFAALIKRKESKMVFKVYDSSDLEECCISRIAGRILDRDPNSILVETLVKNVGCTFRFTSNLTYYDSFTFLHTAIANRWPKSVALLLAKFDFDVNAVSEIGQTPLQQCFDYWDGDWNIAEADPRFAMLQSLFSQPGLDFSAGHVLDRNIVYYFLGTGAVTTKLLLEDGRCSTREAGKELSALINAGWCSFAHSNLKMPRLLLHWEESRIDASEECLEKLRIPDEIIPRILSFIFPSGLITYVDEDRHSISQAMEFERRCNPNIRDGADSWEERLIFGCTDEQWLEVANLFRVFEKRVEKFEEFRSTT
eukprot:gene729-847_t